MLKSSLSRWKNHWPWSLLLLTVVLLLPFAVQAETPPAFPHYLYGHVNDLPGASLAALVDGTKVAETTLFSADGSTVYAFSIPADDPTTPQREGAREGEIVSFTVSGFPVQEKIAWYSGHVNQLDLFRTKLPFRYLPLILR